MPYEKMKPVTRKGARTTKLVYRCDGCAGCRFASDPLAPNCLSPTTKHGRTITRDDYEEVRERTASRMTQASSRELYNRRPHIAETPFGILKSVMGIRQFLLRELPKVKTEWRWAATAFNLAKLVKETARMRAELMHLAVAGKE